ncbi:MAG: trimethylamine methyltransferase family protein [Desulfobacterales bacterium]
MKGFSPSVSWLSETDKRRIDEAVRRLLSDVGMRIYHEEALALLEKSGCRPDGEGMVRIPPDLLQQSLDSAPASIAVFDRNGEPAMDLGEDRSYFGTGSDLLYVLEGKDYRRRRCVLEDVARAARVCDALPNIDFIMSYAHPSDVAPHRAYLLSFQAMAENSTKPIVCTAEGRADLEEMWHIGRLIRGGEEALARRPYFIHYAEPISPLKHPFESVDKLFLCADKRIPVVYSPAPIAGSTAPMTVAGHLVQGLAECFCGLVLHQLRSQGAPFIMGMGPAVLDMATTQCSYNAPEYYLSLMGMVEMSRYYDLPNWGYAATSDAQIPDGQAAFEAGFLSYLSASAGSNLNHDVGYLDFGRTGCLEMIVVSDEMIDQIRRLQRGIPVDEEQIALEVVREVGADGHFLDHDHTFRHFPDTQWRPKLFNRKGYEEWDADGRKDLMDRARKRLARILENGAASTLADPVAEKIRERVERFGIT